MFSSTFMLPEVKFWCSPVELELEPGQRPARSVSPLMSGSNTTDHCLVTLPGTRETQPCPRWSVATLKTQS